ncbi:MAG TPA: ATP-binding protein [Alphaproteobacteria bacterium]|nr:ATP-binding protein [Alphaproteobacteria bacterium]
MKLFARLLVLIVLTLAPALAVQLWNEIDLRRDRIGQLSSDALRQAQLVASDQDEIIQGAQQLMVALDHMLAAEPVACEAILVALEPEYRRFPLFVLVGISGEKICASTDADLEPLLSDLSPYISTALQRQGLFIGGHLSWNGIRGLPLLHPVHRTTGAVKGVLITLLDLNWLEHRLNQQPRSGRDVLVLTDRHATVLARAPALDESLPRISGAGVEAVIRESHEGTVELDGIDGVRRVYGFVPTETRPEGIFVIAGLDKAAALEAIDRASFRGFGLVFVGMLAAFLVAWIGLDRTILRPIRVLRRAAVEWQRGFRPQSLRLPSASPEFQELTSGFTDMAHALTRREQEWQSACRRAEEAAVVKNRLLAAAGHDLKQPLNTISLSLQMLRHSPDVQQRAKMFKLAGQAVSKLSCALDTLLEASRLETGLISPRHEDLPIAEILEEIEDVWTPLAAEKGLAFRVRPNGAWIRSDRDMLSTILSNLVSNAIRYTNRGGVLVGCHRREGKLLLAVYDTGIGISPEAMDRVFDEFHQVDPRATEGFGLGLSIVRRLAALLAHTLVVRSQLGRGSRFGLLVPVATPAQAGLAAELALDSRSSCPPLAGNGTDTSLRQQSI